jgi:glutaredoxin 1/glutaredoxin 3
MYKIYGHSQCGYCQRAKDVLTEKGISYEYLDIRQDKEAFEAFSVYNFKTVPVITDGGVLVGGFDKLLNYLESKEVGDFEIEL